MSERRDGGGKVIIISETVLLFKFVIDLLFSHELALCPISVSIKTF
jgi:hypothetical protein